MNRYLSLMLPMKTCPALLLGVFLIFLQAGCDKPSASGGAAASDGPSATIRQLFTLIQEGKVDDATKLCSDKITQDKERSAEVKSTFAALTPKIKDQGGLTVEILSEDITGDTATVSFNLRYGNGTAEACKYRLIKEHGGWKHDGNA
jgi:Domain of unknown function (DUF4878)